MYRITARIALTLTTAVGATLALPLAAATAAPVDGAAQGLVVAKGGLVGHVRPSRHAPANYTFPNGSKGTLDCRVSGTVVDGNRRWFLVVAEGDANWVSARYVRSVGPAPEPATRATAPSRRRQRPS